MANVQSLLLGIVGSTFNEPNHFTAQSPSYSKYQMFSTIIDYGDATGAVADPTTGIVPLGFVDVQFHRNNQWITGTYYVNQSGATLFGLIG